MLSVIGIKFWPSKDLPNRQIKNLIKVPRILYLTSGYKHTQVKIVHDVCLEYVFKLDQLWAVWITEQWVISISAKYILICR